MATVWTLHCLDPKLFGPSLFGPETVWTWNCLDFTMYGPFTVWTLYCMDRTVYGPYSAVYVHYSAVHGPYTVLNLQCMDSVWTVYGQWVYRGWTLGRDSKCGQSCSGQWTGEATYWAEMHISIFFTVFSILFTVYTQPSIQSQIIFRLQT